MVDWRKYRRSPMQDMQQDILGRGKDESRVECRQEMETHKKLLALGRSPTRRGFPPRTRVQNGWSNHEMADQRRKKG